MGNIQWNIATWNSHLNIEDITDVDYAHRKKVGKDLETKNLAEHHDLHVQSDTLLLADVFKSFQNMCLEIGELDPVLPHQD